MRAAPVTAQCSCSRDGVENMLKSFPQEDREQFAQLIGYSICGYHELSYVSDESAAQASDLAGRVVTGAGGCRDAGCSIHGGPLYDDDGRRIA